MSISNPEFSSSTLLNPVQVSGPDGEHKKSLGVMMLAAIGVVFGDIGTSPLYALNVSLQITVSLIRPRRSLVLSP